MRGVRSMKRPALYIVILVATAAGFGAGDFFARTMLVVEANRLVEVTRLSTQVAEESRLANARFRAEQALWTAELLRDGNTADAIRLSEDVIENLRAELERAKAAEAQDGGGDSYDRVLDRISKYQTQYPWVPPAPNIEAEEFASRVGSWRPFVRDGQVSLRVQDVRAGSFFSRLGLKDGELIVAVNGRSIDDALAELVAALERGEPVTLSIQSASGETREVRGAAKPEG